MKVTVAFLKKSSKKIKKTENTISQYVKMIYQFGYCAIFFGLLTFAVSKVGLPTQILNFATNFRQAEDKKIQVTDMLYAQGIYNKDNYIVRTSGTLENENIVENAKDTNLSEEERLIDSCVLPEAKEVFSNKTSDKAVITAENNSLQRISIGNLKILNYSSVRNIDFDKLMSGNIILTKKSDKILLYNTHTSESYANSEGFQFSYTGTARTTDANYNMLCVAKELSKNLNAKGFECIQDTTPHDYGAYTNAYTRSRATITSQLEKNGSFGIVMDVHRDAVADLNFRPVTQVKGIQVAQLMFVMGVGTDTTKNPHYEENLKLVLQLQKLADQIYPGLFRPMMIRNSVYNQDLNKYSLLVEVGATGNTIEEVKLSMRCLTNLLNIIYKD